MTQNAVKIKKSDDDKLIIAQKELFFLKGEKEKMALALSIACMELAFQNDLTEKRAAELVIANKELAYQNKLKEKRATELVAANEELAYQNKEKEKRAEELVIVNKELAYQNEEKEKRAAELSIANIELAFQTEEKEKRAAELITSTLFDIIERKKMDEHIGHLAAIVEFSDDAIISKTLDGTIKSWNNGAEKMFGYTSNQVVGKNVSLIIPPEYFKEEKMILERIRNNEIIDHYETIRNRITGEKFHVSLTISPLKDQTGSIIGVSKIVRDITSRKKFEAEIIQKTEDLVHSNKELAFQNEEKEKRAVELSIANIELAFQNNQKEKLAAELIIANKELAFQNEEKEKRAEELSIANIELAFQNDQKEKRAEELVVANKELAYQNDEKEKRAAELSIANKDFEAFTFVSSHDLQEPLRKIQTFVTIMLEKENQNLSVNGKYNLQRIQAAATRMRQLIEDLLAFSRLKMDKRKFEKTDLNIIVEQVKTDLKDIIYEKQAAIESTELGSGNIIAFQFRQLMHNLIGNALKFSNPGMPSHIVIKSKIVKGSKINNQKLSPEKNFCHISVVDNGIGFEPHFSNRIFEVFQKLRGKEEYGGTGIGLAIVKKIVENHNGIITATSELYKGATFDIYIPAD